MTPIYLKDVALRLLQNNPNLVSQFGSSMVTLVVNNQHELLELTLHANPPTTHNWEEYNAALCLAIEQKSAKSLRVLLSDETISALSMFMASIHIYLKMAISKAFAPNVESLLAFRSCYSYSDACDAIILAATKSTYEMIQIVVVAFCDGCDSCIGKSPQNDIDKKW